MSISKQHKQGGFTLLEMLVALGIFTIVAVIAVGSLVRITSLNKQAQTLQSSVNSLTSVLETMSREMRVGQYFDCDAGSPDIDWSGNTTGGTILSKRSCSLITSSNSDAVIAFESQETADNGNGGICHLIYAYWFDYASGKLNLKKAQQSSCTDVPDFYSVLDQANINLNSYGLGVYRPTGSASHAFAFVRLSGYSGTREREKNSFDVQTSVSERISE